MALPKAGVELVAEGLSSFMGDMRKSTGAVADFGHQGEKAGNVFHRGFTEVVVGGLREIGAASVRAVGMAVGAFGSIVKTGIELNASAEQTKTAFTTLLGSGKAADVFLKDLSAFSASTPFEFPELAENSKQLLAMGFNAKDIIPIMTDVGDTVSALGGGPELVGRINAALGQMQLKGKASNEEMMQLAEAGVPAYKFLADELGITVDEVQKLNEKGLIPADLAIAAIRKGMHETFGGAMQAQAQTFNGLLSTLKDNASLALMAFTGPLFDLAKSALTEIGNLVSSPAFQEFAQILGDQVAGAIKDITDLLTPAIEAVGEIVEAFTDAGAMSSEFGEAVGYLASQLGLPGDLIQDIVSAVQDAIASFQDGGKSAIDLGGVFDDLSGIFQKWFGVARNVFDGYMNIAQAILPIVAEFWQKHGDEITTFLKETYDKIIRIIDVALDLYNAIVPPILNAIAGFIREHGDDIMHILENAWKVISGVIEGALALIEGLLKAAVAVFKGDWEGLWLAIQQMSVDFTLALGKVIEGFLETIAGFFGTSLQGIVDLWQGNWDMMVEIVQKIPGAMLALGKDIINGLISGIRGASGNLLSFMRQLGVDAIEAVKRILGISSPSRLFAEQVGQPIIQGIVLGLTETTGALVAALSDIGTKASDTFDQGDLPRIFEAFGADIIDGLVDGMKDQMRSVRSIISSTATTVADVFQSALGIGSPSQVIAETVGQPIIMGLISGIESALPQLLATLNNVEQELIDQAKEIAESVQDALSDLQIAGFASAANIDRQTLKNLRDLDKLSEGARAGVEAQLTAARNIAGGMADPKEAAAFFKQKSEQIFELAKLNDQIRAATAKGDTALRDRLIQEYQLINAAQVNESQALELDQQRSGMLDDIVQKMREFLSNSAVAVNDTGPGADLMNMLKMLEGLTRALPMTPAQIWGSAIPVPTTTNTTNLNMPIYTNQSPSAIRDSMAIVMAMTT